MLFLSMHAVQRLIERDIKRDEVAEALANVEVRYTSDEDPEAVVILGSTASGRRLKVVVAAYDEEFVITAADRDSEEGT